MLRDFVLAALDSVHEISQLNFKIVDKFNNETSKNENFLLKSEYFLNPIPSNHPDLIEDFELKIASLSKAFNRLSALNKGDDFEKLIEQYLECIYEIGEFFISEELVGFHHSEGQKQNVRRWSTDWLDKACDQEHYLEIQIEEYLIKLLKI